MDQPPSTKLSLGIDTGGTFTDAVLLDRSSRQVVKKVKVRTTHHDLKLCIGEALKQIVPSNPESVAMASLSTTLATNAIVEGKRRPAALMLLGYDPDLVRRFRFDEQFGAFEHYFIAGLHGLDGIERQPLDETALLQAAEQAQERVEAFAVCAYSGPIDASHEQRAAELLTAYSKLPVVQAHHLSSELNSIWRATTAALNASLLGNTQEFLSAVETMMKERGLLCPVMIVRGDGTLARAEFARQRPLEIVHSGPATSAIGARYLADVQRALVVDFGGTTTDLAVIEDGQVQSLERAATVGSYQTCIRTIRARSFGLGGDSCITFDHWRFLQIGPERALPISYLCAQEAQVKEDLLRTLRTQSNVLYSENLEYWLLRREPTRSLESSLGERLIELLRRGPQRYADLRKQVGSIPPFVRRELLGREIIERAALTPTDLLHVSGEFTAWDVESALAWVKAASRIWNESPGEFVCRVRGLLTQRIVAEIIQFLSRKSLSQEETTGIFHCDGRLDRWLMMESISPSDPFLGCKVFLKMPLVGIGAPAQAFLQPVAEVLGTELLLPDHYEVANAVGAAVSGVAFQAQAEVIPYVEGAGLVGYFSRAANTQRLFSRYEDALAHARQTLAEFVEGEARAAGAEAVSVEIIVHPIWDGMARLEALAVGQPVG
jgi:N-methylhydantoinase A/oxoprolinase/acetone carboxylase beta subunit